MSATCLTQALLGKPIVSVTNGEIFAKVQDILVDPNTLQVAAAVISKGSMLKRQQEFDVVSSEEVQVWGQDAVLVTGSDPANTIVEMANSGTIDMIMLATHGRGGRDRLMFGSVADTVIRHTHRPVFLLPVRSKAQN